MSDDCILQQDFKWHDVADAGSYEWGIEGYLKMDGSSGRIQCRRVLEEPITESVGAVEITVQFTLGKSYRILLLDSLGRPAIECLIDHGGRIRFHDGERYVDSGVSLEPNQLWTAESQPHRLWFGQMSFQEGSFRFEYDETMVEGMPFCASSTDVSHLELQTGATESGAVLWLDSYRQLAGSHVVEEEDFLHRWEVFPYVPTGHAQEKWDTTTYRPVDYHWLEVRTRYGGTFTRFPHVVSGSVELDMMTQDVTQETQVSLGEYQRWATPFSPGLWKLVMGVFAGLWTPMQDWVKEEEDATMTQPFGYSVPFDNAPTPENDVPYRVRIEWNTTENSWGVSIDETEMLYKKATTLQAFRKVDRGIDSFLFHPGNLNPTAGPVRCYYLGNVCVRTAS